MWMVTVRWDVFTASSKSADKTRLSSCHQAKNWNFHLKLLSHICLFSRFIWLICFRGTSTLIGWLIILNFSNTLITPVFTFVVLPRIKETVRLTSKLDAFLPTPPSSPKLLMLTAKANQKKKQEDTPKTQRSSRSLPRLVPALGAHRALSHRHCSRSGSGSILGLMLSSEPVCI